MMNLYLHLYVFISMLLPTTTHEEVSMTRTTVCLHESILKTAKQIAHDEQRTLGETISELLGIGIHFKKRKVARSGETIRLKTYSMGSPNIPLEDKEAILSAIEKRRR
jgi:hypothetical protein